MTACAPGRLGARLCLTAATLIALAAPSTAAGQACPSADVSYTGNCGPTFSAPTWTDAGGWTDPSQYSTIQLADVNGDGKDELLGRSDAGLQIWWFDTSVGQWRPQVDADAVPQILGDFELAARGRGRATDWTKPYYYATIQAANIDGQPGSEILARFSDGMRVYKYLPPSGGPAIDGGSWTRIGTGGPFSDAEDYGNVSLYSRSTSCSPAPTARPCSTRAGTAAPANPRSRSTPGRTAAGHSSRASAPSRASRIRSAGSRPAT